MNAPTLHELGARIEALEARLAGLDPDARAMLSVARVADIVADAARLTRLHVADLLSERKDAEAAHPRFAVYWAARTATGYSYGRIGKAVGDRDHTTVISGIKRADRLRDASPEFRLLTDRLVASAQERTGQ